MEPERVREIFHGSLIQVAVEEWPGRTREVVLHPGACGIVAFTPVGDVLLVRQVREAVRDELLEIPAGVIDPSGESFERCAARELLEETGHRATRIQPLASIYTSPGFTDERIELFLADAVPEGVPADSDIQVVPVPFVAALNAVLDGRIPDAKTVAALLLARDAQDRRGRGGGAGSASG